MLTINPAEMEASVFPAKTSFSDIVYVDHSILAIDITLKLSALHSDRIYVFSVDNDELSMQNFHFACEEVGDIDVWSLTDSAFFIQALQIF